MIEGTTESTPPENNDYKQRVRDEHAQLQDRLTKLEAYLAPVDESKPQPYNIRILFRQRNVMREYAAILADRIHNFD